MIFQEVLSLIANIVRIRTPRARPFKVEDLYKYVDVVTKSFEAVTNLISIRQGLYQVRALLSMHFHVQQGVNGQEIVCISGIYY